MMYNTPHSLWPSYSEEIYYKTYQQKSTGVMLDIPLHDGVLSFCFTELKWDSLHFGYACYKFTVVSSDNIGWLNKDDMIEVRNKIKTLVNDLHIRFMFADIDSANPFLNDLIQKIGFKFIVNWLDGFIETRNYPVTENVIKPGMLKEEEIDRYANLAKKHYYKGGRFYADGNFDRKKVDELYAALIHNSINESNFIITETVQGEPAGLFICKNVIQYEYTQTIDVAHLRFLLLNPELRGNRIGEKLFMKTLSYLKDKCSLVTTGIETHNIISLNLHTKLGFKFNYSHNAYHYWNDDTYSHG